MVASRKHIPRARTKSVHRLMANAAPANCMFYAKAWQIAFSVFAVLYFVFKLICFITSTAAAEAQAEAEAKAEAAKANKSKHKL